MNEETREKLQAVATESLQARLSELRRIFDFPRLEAQLEAVEAEMNLPEFWEDKTRAQSKMAEVAALKNKVLPVREMNSRIGDLPLLIEMALEENDEGAAQEALKEVETIQVALDKIELQTLLSGPHDREGAYLTVHAGAGGTEACDWADMLVRMYQRWGAQQGFKVEMIDVQEGEEVGVRGATLRFEGENAYGYLNCERGVHRLVRISPFDSQARRHTSFASIDVTPDLEEEPELEIDEKDLEITTMRSGGKGGQNVNKVETGVLMRHLPSGVMVRCTVERSQHKNRDLALKILKAKLLQIEEDKKRSEMERVYGEKGEIGFGSQIRSYVFQPYQMVKDHRTGCETSNIQHVMDGDLGDFIEAKLRGHVAGESRDEV
ncbi:MAG: peptide chain release factor 2 [Verrucomicrobiales bacterium]|nr:peptide chain release factor 2 [Verrucomicrobiales bacterium]